MAQLGLYNIGGIFWMLLICLICVVIVLASEWVWKFCTQNVLVNVAWCCYYQDIETKTIYSKKNQMNSLLISIFLFFIFYFHMLMLSSLEYQSAWINFFNFGWYQIFQNLTWTRFNLSNGPSCLTLTIYNRMG